MADSMRFYSPDHVTTVYNAMDFNRLSWIGEDHYIDTSSKAIRCMIMGNHYERKGVDIAAKAVQMLNGGGTPTVLYIALNDSVVPALRDFLHQHLGTDDFDSYIKPIPARNDIATYYKKSMYSYLPVVKKAGPGRLMKPLTADAKSLLQKFPDKMKIPSLALYGAAIPIKKTSRRK